MKKYLHLKLETYISLILLLINSYIYFHQSTAFHELQRHHYLLFLAGLGISSILIYTLGLAFVALGGFFGGFCITFLLLSSIIDAYLAWYTQIYYIDALNALSDIGNLVQFWWAVLGLIILCIIGGFFFQFKIQSHKKIFLKNILIYLLISFIALFTFGRKKDDINLHLFPLRIGYNDPSSILDKGLPAYEKIGNFAQNIRKYYRGLDGDLGALFILSFFSKPENFPLGNHQIPDGINKTNISKKTVVLIIGEASSNEHYSLYGYPIKTTPEIDEMEKKGLACHINQTYADAPYTSKAVLPLISFWTPEEQENIFHIKNIPELAHENHFKSYWLSTQYETGAYGGYIGYIAKHTDFQAVPPFSAITNNILNHKKYSTSDADETLLPILKDVLKDASDKKFIIFHIWGSHVPYMRHVSEEDKKALPKANSYDQSIHRTDRIISKLIKDIILYDPQAIILYTSDHGEDVEHGGHSLSFGHQQYKIPEIIFGNNNKDLCHIAEKMKNSNGYLNTKMNHYILSYLLGWQMDNKTIEMEKSKDTVLLMGGRISKWENIPEWTK